MSELQKIIPIDPQEISDSSIASMAQGNFFQGMSLGGMTAVLFCMASGGPLLALIVGSMFAGAIALKLLKMLSIHNAGQRGDLEKVLSLLPGQQRSELLSVAKQKLNPQPVMIYNGQGVTPQHLPTSNHFPAPSNMVTTSAEPVEDAPPAPEDAPAAEEPNPFQLEAIAPPAATVTIEMDDPVIQRPKAPGISAKWNDLQWALWTKISTECPNLRYLIFDKLVVISGPQQTGKSSLASAVAYCRMALLFTPVFAITPHTDGEKIFRGRVIGSGGNFEQIQDWYLRFKDTLGQKRTRTTLIVDELTQYRDRWQSLGQSIIWSALSESDKHGYAPILLNHASTVSGGFAGIQGAASLIESSATRVQRGYASSEWGESVRSPEIAIALPGKKPIQATIPDWFHLPALEALCPVEFQVKSQAQPAPTPEPQDEPSAEPQPPSAASPLEEWIERLNQYRAENPTATKPECLTAITGKQPGGNKLYRTLQNSWNP